ncbi:MAG TPA: DUF1365 family protein, partial [Solirubrobacteraceae bacterium]|nr:DUF1365 family protein [Solirubrobacteraceae bacterium]
SFYYLFDREEPGEERLRAAVAEVTNTPWGERHSYVLAAGAEPGERGTRVLRGTFAKELHVSPLMGMEHEYDWRAAEPGERLSLHIASHDRATGGCAFDATLSLRRREITAAELRRVLVRYPLLSVRVLARIYAGTLSLRLRGARYHPHPGPALAGAPGELAGPATDEDPAATVRTGAPAR